MTLLSGSAAGLVCLLLAGCAFTDATVVIEHQRVFQKPLVTDGAAFRLGPIRDRRSDPSRIGCKKSGYGGESAGIFLSLPLEHWFRQELLTELQGAGLRPAVTDDGKAVRIEVDVLNFFAEPDVGLNFDIFAIVHAEVRVYFPDGTAFARRFAATAHKGFMTVMAGNFVEIISQAMEDWLRQAVPAVVNLLQAHAGGRLSAAGWSSTS